MLACSSDFVFKDGTLSVISELNLLQNLENPHFWSRCHLCNAVIFNRGSAEPKGSASICQGFRSWPVEIT